MKFPTIAVLFALSTQCKPASTASASNVYSQLNVLSLISEEAVVASSSNNRNRTHQIKRHRRRLPPSAHHHRELHPHPFSSSSLCSCSPTTFELRLDFSNDCSRDTIKTNAGIRGTLCLLGEAGNVGVGPLLPLPIPPPPPAPSSSQTIPPVMGSEPATDAPTSSTYNPTFSPTVVESPDPILPPTDDGGDGGTANTVVPMETYYPTFGPTNAEDGTESDPNTSPADNATTTPLPTYYPTASIVAEPTKGKGKGKGVKGRIHAAPGNNNADTSLKWIFSDSISSLEEPAIPTYHPTSVEARTPYPTVDSTYAPTFSDTAWSSLSSSYAPTTSSHAKNLEEHMTDSSSESVHNRHLQEKTSVIGEWTSIPPNDEFFRKFPEWKARQEKIYQLKQGTLEQGASTPAVHEYSSRRNLQEDETPTSYPTYLTTVVGTTTEDEEADYDDDADVNNNNNSPTSTPTYITAEVTTDGDDSSTAPIIPNKLLSAQFLEMDTSPNMNIINQDDQYIDFSSSSEASGPSSSSITSFTLSYTSISAYLNPNISLDKQLEYVPGGVILILVGQTEGGEIVRNRVMWTYTMGCDIEDVTVEVGDLFGWTMFDKLKPAIPDFCPSSGGGGGISTPTYMPTSEAVSASSKADKPSSKSSKPHKPSSSSSSSSSEDNDLPSSKSGKPGLSMPSSEDLVDHFDFGKSGKSSSASEHHSKSSKKSSTHSEDEESSEEDDESSVDDEVPLEVDDEESSEDEIASMPSSRLLHIIDIKHPRHFDLNQQEAGGVEEYTDNEVFGRRLSQQRETTLRRGSTSLLTLSSSNGEAQVKDPYYDKPLKKRLRNRSV